MRGSIRQRGEDRYQLRVYVGTDHQGKSRYKVETVRGTRRDADRRLRALLDEVDAGNHHGPDHTVGQLLDAWVDARLADQSPSSQASTMVHIRRYLRPELGPMKLSKLDPAAIDAFYGRIRREGARGKPLADATVVRVHSTLRGILRQAVDWGWLAVNPAERARPPRSRRVAPTPPDAAQVRALFDEAAKTNPPFHAYLRVAAAAGPRRGETAGLRRSDVDYEAGEVVFRRSVVLDSQSRVAVQPYTKTGGQRRVALDPATLTTLRLLEMEQAERALMFGVPLAGDPWLFSFAIDGSQPPRPDAFTRAFGRAAKRLGLTVRLHDLRHYHATALISAGVDVRTVAGRLGHANASTTLNIYAAWQPAADRSASDIAAELLGD
jgi:integrase